jgi:hypothetical protein
MSRGIVGAGLSAIRTEGITAVDRLSIRLEALLSRHLERPTLRETDRWLERLHGWLDVGTPCDQCGRFERDIWTPLMQRIGASPQSAAHQHDSDFRLALTHWAVTKHLQPDRVVETGVARGLSSAAILQAMHENQRGHLYSVDLPPLRDGWGAQAAIAINPSLAERWTYIRGATRRRLPGLLEQLQCIDVFIHDSLHTYRTMRFELDTAWRRLRKGGVLVADDIESNLAFEELSSATHAPSIVVRAPSKKGSLFGILIKRASR